MPETLLLLSWIVGVLYSSVPLFWFVIHPLAARWQRMRRSPYLLLLPFWTVIIAGLAFVAWPWRERQIYSFWWMWLAAAPFLFVGLRTYVALRSGFGRKRITGEAEVRPEENELALVTGGLHGVMRHPIYFAHLCVFAGWTVGSGLLVNFVLLGISLVFTFPLMIWMEERELEKRFGDAYREYKRRVPLLPLKNQKLTTETRRHGEKQGN